MSSPHLPENLNEWPESPYAILGVEFGIEPRDLKRAYTQLVRSWKPEQYPEHFRRIREAYETVLRHVPFFGIAAAAPSDASESAPVQESTTLEQRAPDLMEQMQAQWELACRGEDAEAYAGLRKLKEQYPTCDEIYMGLYWLLRLAPEVDSIRKPADWLVAGLLANNMTGPLRELYRRELTDNPGQVGDDIEVGLPAHYADSAQVVELADWRWLAAARVDSRDWILADISTLREKVNKDDPERWFRLLTLAVNHLAWAPGQGVRRETARLCARLWRMRICTCGSAMNSIVSRSCRISPDAGIRSMIRANFPWWSAN